MEDVVNLRCDQIPPTRGFDHKATINPAKGGGGGLLDELLGKAKNYLGMGSLDDCSEARGKPPLRSGTILHHTCALGQAPTLSAGDARKCALP